MIIINLFYRNWLGLHIKIKMICGLPFFYRFGNYVCFIKISTINTFELIIMQFDR